MADLIDRISGEAGEKINLHAFMGAERLYALGELTGAEIVAAFGLEGDALTQANALKAQIDGLTGAEAKALYILRVESVMMLVEDRSNPLYWPGGVLDRARVLEDILIS